MSFEDWDAGEELLGMSVKDMNDELLPYALHMHQEILAFPLIVSHARDRAIVRRLRKDYRDNAGQIVKWMFFHYHGKYDGQTFAFPWFAIKRKWFTDQMFSEMKRSTIKPVQQTPTVGVTLGRDRLSVRLAS